MAWSDLAKSALDFALGSSAPESESVDYKSLDGLGAEQAPWIAIRAQVDREPDLKGFIHDGQTRGSTLSAWISKSEISAIVEQRDQMRVSGRTYRVVRILSESTGGFEVLLK